VPFSFGNKYYDFSRGVRRDGGGGGVVNGRLCIGNLLHSGSADLCRSVIGATLTPASSWT